MSTMYYTHLDSPVGAFLVAGTESEIHFTAFSTGYQQRAPLPDWCEDDAPLGYATQPLTAYFEGMKVHFDVPLALTGTPFQLRVWRALQTIGYGQTASYSEIAAKVGSPAASRAVGSANHANPIPIIVPCHRIVGADGSLTGFGGGLDTKATLLEMEKARGQIRLL